MENEFSSIPPIDADPIPFPNVGVTSEISPADMRASKYSAGLDSTTVINSSAPAKSSDEYAQWLSSIGRNVEFLEQLVAADFWQGEDLAPFNQAITKGRKILG